MANHESIVLLQDEATRSEITAIIQAASTHDLSSLQNLIDTSSFTECKAVDVQDPSTGFTPLHAAISACQSLDSSDDPNVTDGAHGGDALEHAHDTVKLLLENGAIWNQLDRNDETPGCIGFRLGLEILYQLMVDAGVRAEMLLNRLDEYDELDGDDNTKEMPNGDQVEPPQEDDVPQLVVTTDSDGGDMTIGSAPMIEPDVTSTQYLSSVLSMDGEKILDEQQNGVMMAWESDIMKQSATALLPTQDLRILNIGFGMGIIDGHIQASSSKPAEHHIIEAHPDVINMLNQSGWNGKPGVTIHEGKWQDVLPELARKGLTFDAVYYDTFAEPYKDFKDFFMEHLLGILEPDGRWSFFNGMGADRQISYDVYQKVVELDLFEAGFEVEWADIDLPELNSEWEGVRRKYWNIQKYRLPLCRFMD